MAQYAYPTSDIDNSGAWTTEPLWEKVDEEPYDDVDYVSSPKSASGKSFTLGLSAVIDPQVHTNHIIRVRAKVGVSGIFRYELLQGVALIKDSGEIALGTSFAEHNMTLSEAEAESISDYSALRVRVTAVTTQKNQYQRVSWIRPEVPDVGVVQKGAVDSGAGSDSVGVKVKASLSDSGGGADIITGMKVSLDISDSGVGADALALIKALLSVADSGLGAEEAKARTSLSILDAATGAEIVSVLSKLKILDSGVGTDTISMLGRLLMQDYGVGADGISVSTPTAQKEVQDSGIGQDVLAIKAILNILDDALGADSLAVRQFRVVSESGIGADILAVLVDALEISDSGLGSEALSIISKVQAVQDAGLVAEILAVLSKVSVQDLAAGVDDAAASSIMEKAIMDSGIGSDMVSALLRTYYPLPFEAEARKRAFDIGAEGRGLSPKERKRAFQAKGRYKK